MPEILGVRVDNISVIEAKTLVDRWLQGDEQKKIFTPNPEMLVLAQKFNHFKQVLNAGDLNLCDGFGLVLVKHGAIKRICGADFVWELCALAASNHKRVFLLGSNDADNLAIAQKNITARLTHCQIVGIDPGPKIDVKDNKLVVIPAENRAILQKINASRASVLIVAFGQIKQEMWLHEFMGSLPHVKVAIGVGGALDYISGKTLRAPRFLQLIGLEWLWRLACEPKRLKRVFRATVLFLYYYFIDKKRK